MITIFADDSKDRKGLGDIAIAISEILHIEDMDISISRINSCMSICKSNTS